MDYRVGICDVDYHYIVNLMDYINSHRECGFKLVAFSSGKAISEYLKKNYLDGVILGEEVDDMEDDRGVRAVRMVTIRDEGPDCIFKYQAADIIACKLMDRLKLRATMRDTDTNFFYGVYSPLGRCGKTNLAMALSRHFNKSLYVGLEEYGGRDLVSENFLYYLSEESMELIDLLKDLWDGGNAIDEISGILCYMDIRQISLHNLQWFKQTAYTELNYKSVVFDIGQAALEDLDMLMSMDVIFVPVLTDDISHRKLTAFKQVIGQDKYKAIEEKLHYLQVPQVAYDSEEMKELLREVTA